MITHQALIGQDKPGSGQEPTNIPRRALLGGAGALVALLASPVSVMAKAPDSPFVILLKGLYEPVVQAPNLGLSVVDLSDGSYSKTKIYPISGIPGSTNPDKTIGDFYAQLTTGGICVPTTSPEARLRCASQVAMSISFPTGSVDSSW